MNRKDIISLARELRKNQTEAEGIMWEILRNRRFEGKKFLRQHPIIVNEVYNKIDFFIADFYCHANKLVLEIDGKIHDFQKEYDRHRDSVMIEIGLNVLRIKNEDIISNIDKVKEEIRTFI
jgi:very-short-patch-repair endonuclease